MLGGHGQEHDVPGARATSPLIESRSTTNGNGTSNGKTNGTTSAQFTIATDPMDVHTQKDSCVVTPDARTNEGSITS